MAATLPQDPVALYVLAERVGAVLAQRGLRLVTAESCTGGGVAWWITAVPGSSDWFDRGFVTYSNAAKEAHLAVDAALLARHGAVSEETAAAMARGALGASHADVAVAVTGIAGPGGGSRDKPVGTVCLAWAVRELPVRTTRRHFPGDRAAVRHGAIAVALQGILDAL